MVRLRLTGALSAQTLDLRLTQAGALSAQATLDWRALHTAGEAFGGEYSAMPMKGTEAKRAIEVILGFCYVSRGPGIAGSCR